MTRPLASGPRSCSILCVRVALSIRQPWAELILRGLKTIEVRSWPTKHRGLLWLHAGKRIERAVCDQYSIPSADLWTGALVGCCELRDCVEFNAGSWTELQSKHLNLTGFRSPLFGWILGSPERKPIEPMPGRLGLMRLPGDQGGN
jgi:hypothetical protein